MRIRKRQAPPRKAWKRTPTGDTTADPGRIREQPPSQRIPAGILPLLDSYGCSEVGRQRDQNEDHFLLRALPVDGDLPLIRDPEGRRLPASPAQTGFLFLVADGIGGAPCGERASAMAAGSLFGYLQSHSAALRKGRSEITKTLRRGIRQCQSDLQAEVDRSPDCEGMSTTLTGLLAVERRLYIVHSGDSRGYLLRRSALTLITNDHSQAQREIDAGAIDREAARRYPGGNSLWNFLTSDYSRSRPDVGSMLLEPGDLLLLCTDGVSDAVPDAEIRRHLSSPGSAESLCKRLLGAARKQGGGDDLTAIVIRFGGCP